MVNNDKPATPKRKKRVSKFHKRVLNHAEQAVRSEASGAAAREAALLELLEQEKSLKENPRKRKGKKKKRSELDSPQSPDCNGTTVSIEEMPSDTVIIDVIEIPLEPKATESPPQPILIQAKPDTKNQGSHTNPEEFGAEEKVSQTEVVTDKPKNISESRLTDFDVDPRIQLLRQRAQPLTSLIPPKTSTPEHSTADSTNKPICETSNSSAPAQPAPPSQSSKTPNVKIALSEPPALSPPVKQNQTRPTNTKVERTTNNQQTNHHTSKGSDDRKDRRDSENGKKDFTEIKKDSATVKHNHRGPASHVSVQSGVSSSEKPQQSTRSARTKSRRRTNTGSELSLNLVDLLASLSNCNSTRGKVSEVSLETMHTRK